MATLDIASRSVFGSGGEASPRRWLAAASPLALLIALGLGAPALGQEEDAELGVESVQNQDADEQDVERIVVRATGTNISGVAPVGSQVLTIDAADIEAVGVSDIADVLRTLPQVQRGDPGTSFSAVQSSDTSAIGNIPNVTRGDAINLRGVGQDATLLLVNGRRVAASGTQRTFTEAVQVPLSAIERVEVIADGASAIYGSDAIAGVVNYVLRDDYQGLEVSGSFGHNEYGDDWTVGALGGVSWDGAGSLGRGNVMFSYEHGRENPILIGQIPRLRQDQRPFGGADGRVVNGQLLSGPGAAIVVGTDPDGPFGPVPGVPNPVFGLGGNFTFYGVPAGVDNPTFSDVVPLQNMPDLLSRSDYDDWRGATDRDQLTLMLNQELAPGIDFFADARYSRRDTYTRTHNPSGLQFYPNINVPYYLNNDPAGGVPHPLWLDVGQGANPFTGVPNPVQVPYNVGLHAPDGVEFANETFDENLSGTLGFRVDLPAEWGAELAYSYSQTRNCGVCYFDDYVNTDTTEPLTGRVAPNALQRAVNENRISPFSIDQLTADQWDFINGTNLQQSQFYNNLATLRFDGPLFDFPAGAVRAAVGGEFQHSVQKVQNAANRPPNNEFILDANSDYARGQYSAFGEVYVPIVGESMNVPLMQSFVIDTAVRYDDYSDFGSTMNPKIGATWTVYDDLDLRGSWGTSYRAPTIPELQRDVFSFVLIGQGFTNMSGVPGIPVNAQGQSTAVNIVVGGNDRLKAEEGTNTNFGFDWTPRVGPGDLRLSATWYRIEYDNRLGAAPSITEVFASPAAAAQFSAQYQVVAIAPDCDNDNPLTWDPAVRDLLGSTPPYRVVFGNVCDSSVIFDGTQTNIAGTLQEGIDLQLNYDLSTDFGQLNFGGNLNYITDSEIQARSTAPSLSNLDGDNGLFGGPVSLRGRAYLGWNQGPWGANVFANHIGDFRVVPATINGVSADAEVPAWTTYDLNFNFDVDRGNWDIPALSGARISFNVNNFTDEDPPIVLTGNGTSSVNFNHDVLGRAYRASLTKVF